MKHLPFNKPGTFWRGNLHTHSTLSDGLKTPEAVCAFYQMMGYDFIAITDHFMPQFHYPITDTRPLRIPTFTTLLGAELHAGKITNGEQWHILAVGLPPDFAPNLPAEDGAQLAARAMATGAFVAVAHPAWYALTEDDVIALGDVHAIEVINGISHDHSDRIDSWYMVDAMRARGRHYWALATDDCHFHAQHNDRILGWVWVKSETLEPESLLGALKAGSFYSSTGPQIFDVQVSGDTVYVQCSPCESIFLTGGGSRAFYVHGNGMLEAELSLKRLRTGPFAHYPHCRVTVRDAHGGRAWTNYFSLDAMDGVIV